MMRNVIGLVLVFAMSGLAFGFAGGDGSEGAPYQVSTVADLLAVNNDREASYIMINDIDLENVTYSHSLIGHMFYVEGALTGTNFSGVFDGDGHIIQNLAITDPNTAAVAGLFGVIGSAIVKDLGIEGVNISGANATGGLAGKCYGTISNCYVLDTTGTGGVASSSNAGTGGLAGTSGGGSVIEDSWAAVDVTGYEQVGGLVGQIRSKATNCYVTGDVEATHAGNHNYIGGFAGRQEEGSITNCYATGNVTACGHLYGGFVGLQSNTCSISRCYATGDVTNANSAATYGGGFVGQSDGAASMISFCYSTGDVNTHTGNSQRVGGFAGQVINLFDSYATGNVTGYYGIGGLVGLAGLGNGGADAQIVRCYATGQVTSTVRPVAGLLAYNYGSAVMVIDCFWDTETSGTPVGIDYNNTGGVTGKTTAEMMTESTFTDAGWDFETFWMKLGKVTAEYPGYPVLWWQIDLSASDFNKDGIVNLDDFTVMSGEWLSESY